MDGKIAILSVQQLMDAEKQTSPEQQEQLPVKQFFES